MYLLSVLYIEQWKKKKSHEINNDKNFRLVSGHAYPQGSIFKNGRLYTLLILYLFSLILTIKTLLKKNKHFKVE